MGTPYTPENGTNGQVNNEIYVKKKRGVECPAGVLPTLLLCDGLNSTLRTIYKSPNLSDTDL